MTFGKWIQKYKTRSFQLARLYIYDGNYTRQECVGEHAETPGVIGSPSLKKPPILVISFDQSVGLSFIR
jgi:hypothetical protein